MREQQLRKEAEIFGLWNPEATARKLGFGVEDTDGENEEDGARQVHPSAELAEFKGFGQG
jgi:hypothetical protein